MKITKKDLEILIKEAASEYVWGVKNPSRLGNQYKVTTLKKIIKEELEAVLERCWDGYERVPNKREGEQGSCRKQGSVNEEESKKDACYHKVKSRYDVWPSAYASGALVKCRKVGAKNWGKSTTKEELGLYEGEESLEAKIRNTLIEEGGAAGMKALVKGAEASEKEIKEAIKGMEDVGLHEDGDYILQDKGEIDVEKTVDENLRDWFGKSKSKDGKAGWVDVSDGDACAREKGETATPKCVSRSKYDSMTPKERKSAQRRKRAKDPNQPKKTGAAKPTYVKTDKKKKKTKKEGLGMNKELLNIIKEEMEGVLREAENAYYDFLAEGETIEEAEYQGRKVTLNKPTRGDVKKSKVYVKNAKGNVVKVNFGDPNMKIKKNIPARRKSFRARHNCDNPGPKWKARYWSCKAW